MCIKLKYIQIPLDIYQHISYHGESKKGKKLTFQKGDVEGQESGKK